MDDVAAGIAKSKEEKDNVEKRLNQKQDIRNGIHCTWSVDNPD